MVSEDSQHTTEIPKPAPRVLTIAPSDIVDSLEAGK